MYFRSLVAKQIHFLDLKREGSMVSHTLNEGASNLGLEVWRPATLRCIPIPSHPNQMAESLPQFSRFLLMASLCESGV